MPAYDYTCPVCGHKEERIVKMEERDEQTCSNIVNVDAIDHFGALIGTDETPCEGKMERDEIALTARMSDAWRF